MDLGQQDANFQARSQQSPSSGSEAGRDATEEGYQITAAAALSHRDSDEAYNTSDGKKRKLNGTPGSRGVANLTPSQLAKKRASDREAQRAIRERTKGTIESLQRRIEELETQQGHQELQKVIVERDCALRDCETMRKKLKLVAELAGLPAQTQPNQTASSGPAHNHRLNLHGTFYGVDGPKGLEKLLTLSGTVGLAALTAQQAPLPPLGLRPVSDAPLPGHQVHNLHPVPLQGDQQHNLHPDLRTPSAQSRSRVSTGTDSGDLAGRSHGRVTKFKRTISDQGAEGGTTM